MFPNCSRTMRVVSWYGMESTRNEKYSDGCTQSLCSGQNVVRCVVQWILSYLNLFYPNARFIRNK